MTDYKPFVDRLKAVAEELNRDYDYDDAAEEAKEVGLDADECLVMGLENRVELGRMHINMAIEVIEKLLP